MVLQAHGLSLARLNFFYEMSVVGSSHNKVAAQIVISVAQVMMETEPIRCFTGLDINTIH
jgi:hypothetical protein